VFQAESRAKEAKNGIELAYSIPKEGAQLGTDMMAIPADAAHPQNAMLFIDFILRPEIVAAITNTVGYPNPNAKATDLVQGRHQERSQHLPARRDQGQILLRQAGRRPISSACARAPGPRSSRGAEAERFAADPSTRALRPGSG